MEGEVWETEFSLHDHEELERSLPASFTLLLYWNQFFKPLVKEILLKNCTWTWPKRQLYLTATRTHTSADRYSRFLSITLRILPSAMKNYSIRKKKDRIRKYCYLNLQAKSQRERTTKGRRAKGTTSSYLRVHIWREFLRVVVVQGDHLACRHVGVDVPPAVSLMPSPPYGPISTAPTALRLLQELLRYPLVVNLKER